MTAPAWNARDVTPVSAQEDVEEAARAIHDYLPTIQGAHQAFKDAKREHSRIYAQRYVSACEAKLPAHSARHIATVRSIDAQKAAEDAEVLYEHARRELETLRGDLMAAQTILRAVVATYGPLSTGFGR